MPGATGKILHWDLYILMIAWFSRDKRDTKEQARTVYSLGKRDQEETGHKQGEKDVKLN